MASGFPTQGRERGLRAEAPYLQALGLTDRDLYDLVGNHFDPDAVLVRVSRAVGDWLLRGAYAGPEPVPPAELTKIFQQVQAEVRRARVPAADSPYPGDLRGQIDTWGDADGTGSSTLIAAEYGRGAQ